MSLSLSKEQYINHLKKLLEDEKGNEVIGEGYYEWEIEDWDKIKDKNDYEFSPEFDISGYHWRMFVYPNGKGNDNKEFLSCFLFNSDVKKDPTLNIFTYFVLCIHNYNNYSCFNTKRSSAPDYYNKDTCVMGFSKYIKKEDLFNKNEDCNCSLIENNKVVFDVYIRIYKKKDNVSENLNNYGFNEMLLGKKEENIQNQMVLEKKEENIQNQMVLEENIPNNNILLEKKEIENGQNKEKINYKENKKSQFVNKLKSLANEDHMKKETIIGEDYYEWKIDNWDEIKDNRTATSPEFSICGYNWRILLYPNGKDDESKDFISFFLLNSDVKKPNSSKVFCYFISYVRNYKDYLCINTKRSQSPDYFDKNTWTMGFSKFIKKDDLISNKNYSNKPIVENNKLNIGIYIRIYDDENTEFRHE